MNGKKRYQCRGREKKVVARHFESVVDDLVNLTRHLLHHPKLPLPLRQAS